jgi:DNA sulfur modification protein DndD
MKIKSIILNNFRQYFGSVTIDLNTNSKQNIVLIGGKNGYGKTNFLLSIVWCLYGENISQIDENFKKEIQKETNYSKFMKQSLNWDAKNSGAEIFSVETFISGIDLSHFNKAGLNGESEILIKREYDTKTMEESLSIINTENKLDIFKDDFDKINFINDYIIPLEAAKFVFFDAEKIASWAELSTKEEGSVLNDALGKLLGLDIYESLKDDLKQYTNNLKKEGANVNIREQITNTENAIELNKNKIESIDVEVAQNETIIKELKDKNKQYQIYLNKNSNKETKTYNIEELFFQKEKLEEKESELSRRFSELSELIPLTMLAGKIEEVIEQLSIQDKILIGNEINSETRRKLDKFVEKLFNQPPEPNDGSMSFKNKIFYSEKAQNLLNGIFLKNDETANIDFEIDLSNADKDLIFKTSEILKHQSKEFIENTIEEFNSIQLEIQATEKKIKLLEADMQDEIVLEYLTKKEETERRLEKVISANGGYENQKEKLLKENIRLNQKYQTLLQRINVTQHSKKKLEEANRYIDAIQSFIVNQKKVKKDALEKNILNEMQKLMHKLQGNGNKFIAETKVEILPDDSGLKVTLYDEDGNEKRKESLSQGEKQIYISSLVKAILQEAIQNFPIFIDTPLGRLDDEHIKNILLYYYPDLSEQVIILATNNEITPRRYKDIQKHVSKAYLLKNINNKSSFQNGYFLSYEN